MPKGIDGARVNFFEQTEILRKLRPLALPFNHYRRLHRNIPCVWPGATSGHRNSERRTRLKRIPIMQIDYAGLTLTGRRDKAEIRD
jgi:hypothetical protein